MLRDFRDELFADECARPPPRAPLLRARPRRGRASERARAFEARRARGACCRSCSPRCCCSRIRSAPAPRSRSALLALVTIRRRRLPPRTRACAAGSARAATASWRQWCSLRPSRPRKSRQPLSALGGRTRSERDIQSPTSTTMRPTTATTATRCLRLSGSYRLRDWIEIGAEVAYMHERGVGVLTGTGATGGEVELELAPLQVFANWIYQPDAGRRFVPYGGIGVVRRRLRARHRAARDPRRHERRGRCGARRCSVAIHFARGRLRAHRLDATASTRAATCSWKRRRPRARSTRSISAA